MDVVVGIPGLDESYLPRWIGYGFGSLLLLNHFVGSDLANITPAQLVTIFSEAAITLIAQILWINLEFELFFCISFQRTEVLGLSLAAFSIILPYLGKFLRVNSFAVFNY